MKSAREKSVHRCQGRRSLKKDIPFLLFHVCFLDGAIPSIETIFLPVGYPGSVLFSLPVCLSDLRKQVSFHFFLSPSLFLVVKLAAVEVGCECVCQWAPHLPLVCYSTGPQVVPPMAPSSLSLFLSFSFSHPPKQTHTHVCVCACMYPRTHTHKEADSSKND